MIDYNGASDTRECLDSIEVMDKTGFDLKVVVLDNGSREAFKNSRKYKTFSLEIIRSPQNLGFTGGHNLIMRKAVEEQIDYLVILNNDTTAEKNLLKELLMVFENDENIGIVGPKIYFAKGHEFHKQRYEEKDRGNVLWYAGGAIDWNNVIGYHRGVDEVDTGQYDQIGETEFVSGCCMAVKKEVLSHLGLFDDAFFLYYEDNDFCERVKKKGYKILYNPKAIIWHKNAESAGGSGSKLQDYYITRNRLLFGMRYAPLRSKFALFRESIGLFFKGRQWQKRGAFDFYLRRFGKGSY